MAIRIIQIARTPFDYSTCGHSFLIIAPCGPAFDADLEFAAIQFPSTVVGFIGGVFGFAFGRSRRAQLVCISGSSFVVLSTAITAFILAKAGA